MSDETDTPSANVELDDLKPGVAYSIEAEDCCVGVTVKRAVFQRVNEDGDFEFDVVILHNKFGADGGYGRYSVEQIP